MDKDGVVVASNVAATIDVANSRWSVELEGLDLDNGANDGEYSYTVTAVSATNNSSQVSGQFVLDNTISNPDFSGGPINIDGVEETDSGAPILSVSPIFEGGVGETGATVTLEILKLNPSSGEYISSGSTTTLIATGTNWSFSTADYASLIENSGDNEYQYKLSIVDAAGNTQQLDSDKFQLNLDNPVVESIRLSATSDTGDSTRITTPKTQRHNLKARLIKKRRLPFVLNCWTIAITRRAPSISLKVKPTVMAYGTPQVRPETGK